jgi:hypothetical protein
MKTLERFRALARELGRTDCERFADALALHTRVEDDVLYPAAILVGLYIALKLQPPKLA